MTQSDLPPSCPVGTHVTDREHGRRIMAWQAEHAPRAGAEAPRFRLPNSDGSAEVSLDSLLAHRPVVLIFGSFT